MIILQCASALELPVYFIFLYKFVLYIMEQISCLCSVISLKYIHILHNNLNVTSY